MAREVQASEAKAHLPRLLDEVERGETIIITRRGRAIARIIPEADHRQQEIDQAIADIEELGKESGKAAVEEILSLIRVGLSIKTADERSDGMHVLRDAGCCVQCDCDPDRLDVLLGDAVAAEQVAGGAGAVHLKALMRARMFRGETHVMEHRTGVKELGIEAEAATLASGRAPVIDAARVMEQQRWLGILTNSVILRVNAL